MKITKIFKISPPAKGECPPAGGRGGMNEDNVFY